MALQTIKLFPNFGVQILGVSFDQRLFLLAKKLEFFFIAKHVSTPSCVLMCKAPLHMIFLMLRV